MQFFFLLLFNVFLGAVLYLVISLKLERSATEFRERRFRKEMDEIIKEFNVTAERNISLLESRIRVLRILLEKGGDIKSLDITLDEEVTDEKTGLQGKEPPLPALMESGNSPHGEGADSRVPVHGENNGAAMIKKGLLLLFDKIIDILPSKKSHGPELYGSDGEAEIPVSGEAYAAVPAAGEMSNRGRAVIEKDMTMIMPAVTADPREERRSLSVEEIEEIVAASDDRYRLVSVLSDGGCAVEEISRYSGIPAGEVRLVLNLNRSRYASGNSQ